MVELPDQTKRIRPEANRTDSENTGGRSEGHSTENVWNPSETPALDLINLSPRDRLVWDEGYLSGFCHGHEAGRRYAEDEIATLQREAARIVHRLAEIPERDREADRAAAARREARWSA